MTLWGMKPGAPYYVIYNLSQSADGKTVTWMSNPVPQRPPGPWPGSQPAPT